jgi:predicted PurR-regulated permease PerM
VERLSRHVPRFLALVVTLLAFAVVAAGLWAGARHLIIREADSLKARAPAAASRLEAKYSWATKADLTARVDDLVAHFDTPSTGTEVKQAAGTASAYFVPGILVLFLMVYGPRMVEGGLAQLPDERRPVAERLLRGSVADARAQILAVVAQIVAVGTTIGIVSGLAGLEAPFLLGLLAGFFSVLPAMGILLGSLPAVLLAFAFEGFTTGIAVLVVAAGLQALEIAVVRPRMHRTVGDVGPALIAIVALLAYELYGIGGATYAYLGLVFVMAFVRRVGLQHEEAPA